LSQSIRFDPAWVAESRSEMSARLDRALREDGFVQLHCDDFDWQLASRVFDQANWFFGQTPEFKQAFAYGSAAENFGYQGLGDEALDPTTGVPDMKETFTMRNVAHREVDGHRWPSADFRQTMVQFYGTCFDLASSLMRCIAVIGSLPEDYFVSAHTGENVTLRLLYYPGSDRGASSFESEHGRSATPEILAGAHTDYGMMTLLFQDNIGGLQVQSMDGSWLDVVPQSQSVIMNTGDLMAHWSNDRFPSTSHRVRRNADVARLSIAFFCDPDSKTEVEVLPGLQEEGREVRYVKTTAGEHIQRKLIATHEAAAQVLKEP
jgi:isopenicillin N synthase-like dioxygenase